MPNQTKTLSLTAFFTLLLIGFMMGSNHVAARLAFNSGLDVATAVTVRSFVSGTAVTLIIVWGRMPWRMNARQWRGLLVVGLLIGVQSQMLYAAVARLPVALALIVFNTYPLWTVLWNRVFYGKSPDRSVLQAMPIIIVGLFLALDVWGNVMGVHSNEHLGQIGVGVSFGIAAAAIFGFSLVIVQHETAGMDGRVRTAGTMWLAGTIALSVVGMHGGPHWPQSDAGWYALAIFTLLYGSAFTIMFTVLPKLGVGSYAAIMNIEPVSALLMAWLVLGQTIAPTQIAGALLVVGTVMWLGLKKHS